ncbi:Uncharacterised protein [Mycobacteroides abscessus subsp. bolletii]|uniref:hypothetical protein n=1 Tax=Mycobacteroides abscessus TaxID=36809 RepID=UPI0009A77055|nr:hypothetical protein [Mycobacteroides abscessus]SKS72718.1 Uncharacterised protein [Mycobacteroides abscessus subsp. bolletii]SKS84134.1 Uncharacterised protein [Mycobacteroides abscessus subsp. bolletii]
MTDTISAPRTGRWLALLLGRGPHQVIGDPTDPYLSRWFLIPRNSRRNIYLHRFHHSDTPPLHCHPWNFTSIILKGGYYEVTETATIYRRAGTIARRRAQHRHRVVLPVDEHGRDIECLTITITGPRIRPWGFWCPRPGGSPRFVPWREFGPGGCAEPDEHRRRRS